MSGISSILILGGGAIGRALYDGWVAAGWSFDSISIVDALPTRCIGNPDGGSGGSTMMVVAVKPQHVESALHHHADRLRAGDCIVSVAAGIELARLGENTPSGVHVLRAMPSLPVSVGKGSIGLCHQKDASSEMVRAVEAAMSGLGACTLLDEGLIDAFTAMAGSGPAYIFAFTEQLAQSGQTVGLSKEVSQGLARQILIGAAGLLEQSAMTPTQLKEMVTSPGGTTEAGLGALTRDNAMAFLIDGCLTAARVRSQELNSPDLIEQNVSI